MKIHEYGVITICLLFTLSVSHAIASDELYISTGNVVFTENYDRRILIESGVVLKKTGDQIRTDYGDMLPIKTPSGITGLVKVSAIEKFHETDVELAVVKETSEHRVDDNNIVMLIAGRIHPFSMIRQNGSVKYKVVSGVYGYDIRNKKFNLDEPLHITLEPDAFFTRFNVVEVEPDYYKWEYKKNIRGKIAKQKWGCGESYNLVKFARMEAGAEAEASAGIDFFLSWIKANFTVRATASGGSESVVTSEKRDETYQHLMTFWNLRDSHNRVVFRVVIDKLSYCPNASGRSSKVHFALSFPGNELDEFTLDHHWNGWENPNIKDPTHPFYISTMADYYRLKKIFDRSRVLKASEGVFQYEKNLWDLILRQVVTILKPSNPG